MARLKGILTNIVKSNRKMDPGLLAGLSLRAISLTFQLFSGCLKGKPKSIPLLSSPILIIAAYNLLADASEMPT
jgi:hypothetical protein